MSELILPDHMKHPQVEAVALKLQEGDVMVITVPHKDYGRLAGSVAQAFTNIAMARKAHIAVLPDYASIDILPSDKRIRDLEARLAKLECPSK